MINSLKALYKMYHEETDQNLRESIISLVIQLYETNPVWIDYSGENIDYILEFFQLKINERLDSERRESFNQNHNQKAVYHDEAELLRNALFWNSVDFLRLGKVSRKSNQLLRDKEIETLRRGVKTENFWREYVKLMLRRSRNDTK
ncbi:hypothetical protein [Oceanobacillus oncorhynchi]|uniref:hypothetical protein n=1 Tax=Oceanobacillus oncorhynchi TaxID=545501 RepID=UPI0018668E00|nr:hypothetical protein [Oceanobacillus oncorhynchi]